MGLSPNYRLMPLYILLITTIFLFLFYRLWFLRNPSVTIPKDGIISPADGRILKIIEFKNNEPIDVFKGNRKFSAITKDVAKNGYIIIILMNIFNVHWQKAPFDGKIISTKYVKGKFLNAVFGASDLRATAENERCEILMETEKGRIKIIPVAGIIARRIVCFSKEGQEVRKGENISLIKLGSQVVMILPKMDLKIKEGDRVRVGETVIS